MAIVRLDKVRASYNGNLESVKFAADQSNGVVFVLGGLSTGEREVQDAIAPTDVLTQEVLLLAAPEVMYDTRYNGLKNFVNKAGVASRAYHLSVGDIVTVTTDQITGTAALGKYLIPANGAFKLAVAADLTGNTRFAAKIIELTTLGADGAAAVAYQVVKV